LLTEEPCLQRLRVCGNQKRPKKEKTHVKSKKAPPKSKDNINTFISRNCAGGMKTIAE
jgi:hypothetical protein